LNTIVQTPNGLALQSAVVSSQNLDFENFGLSGGAERRIDNGYGGFNWVQAGVYQPDGSIPGYVASSGQTIAFIAEANNNQVAGYEDAAPGSALTITRQEGFTLGSAVFSAAFRDGLGITVRAYADEAGQVLIGQTSFTVDRASQAGISFDPALFGNIRRVEFDSNDGNATTADYFGLDDLVFTSTTLTSRPITTISFDDLPLDAGGEARIANGYAGFQWSQIGAYRPDGTLPGYTTSSGSNLGFIAEAAGGEVAGYEDAAAGSAAVITRDDEFTFLGGSFSATFRDDLNVVVRGFADAAGSVLVAERTISLDRGVAEALQFLADEFAGIRRLEFDSNDGNGATRDYFGFDDLLFV